MSHTYVYTVGTNAGKDYTKVKKDVIWYFAPGFIACDLEKMEKIVGITTFKKAKKDKDSVIIGEHTYLVEKVKKNSNIHGYIETEDGHYIAIYLENNIFWITFFILWAALMIGLIVKADNKNDAKSSISATSPPKKEWIVGGIDGTDISLNKGKETSYNTYWGYQSITIDKDMKVPFINKDSNTAYAQFTLTDKAGNIIYESELIQPGTHAEWNAYDYYNGESGEYLHDLKVVFYNPIYDEDGEIIDFKASMFAANTPDFGVTIQ